MAFPLLTEWLFNNIGAMVPIVKIHQWENGVKCRNGRVVAVKRSGIKLYIPYFESYDLVDMQEQTKNLLTQTMRTSDDIDVTFSCNVKYKVTSAIKKFTVVHDFDESLLNQIMMVAADVVNKSTLQRISHDKNEVEDEITTRLNEEVRNWGARIKQFAFTDLVVAKPYRFFGDPVSK